MAGIGEFGSRRFTNRTRSELCLAEANDRLPALVAEEIKEEKE